MDGIFVIKDVSVKHFSFFNGGCIGDQERVCKILQFLQWMCVLVIKNVSVKPLRFLSMEYVQVIKNVSVKVVSFFNGRNIRDQERVCQTLQLLPWRVYWCSRTCLWKSSASLMDGIFVIKYVSAKLFSFFNGGCIGDQESVCQTLQLLPMEGVLVFKNVSVKVVSFFNGRYIRDQVRVCQTLQLHSMEGVLVIKNLSVKVDSASLMDGIFMIKNVSVKLFSFINRGYIRDQERVFQTL